MSKENIHCVVLLFLSAHDCFSHPLLPPPWNSMDIHICIKIKASLDSGYEVLFFIFAAIRSIVGMCKPF